MGGKTYPAVLAAAGVLGAHFVAVLGTAAVRGELGNGARDEGQDGEGSELHYEYSSRM
jgi:hypothetical protein